MVRGMWLTHSGVGRGREVLGVGVGSDGWVDEGMVVNGNGGLMQCMKRFHFLRVSSREVSLACCDER